MRTAWLMPLLTLGSALGQVTIMSTVKADGALHEDVVVPEGAFSGPTLRSTCTDLLNRSSSPFHDIWVFTSRPEANAIAIAKGGDHVNYPVWLDRYQNQQVRSIPMAECISIRAASALFIRDARQRVTRAVIEGADPTELNVEGIPIRLGYFRFNPASMGSAKWIVDVFAWTAGPLDESFGVKVLARLKDWLAFEPAYLTLRHDPWFIDDEFYPLFHPFYPEIAPPTREQFETSGTLLCSTRPGKEPLCRLFDHH